MITLLVIFAFVAAGLSIWLVALTSPTGYQDQSGFHFGVQQKDVPQKNPKKIITQARVISKVAPKKKAIERKSASRPRRATAAEWKESDPLADQLKFPFPVTH